MGCTPADSDCGVATNTFIRLRFDRPLLPSTAVRQALRVYTGRPENGAPAMTPRYDVLTRELTFYFNGRLLPKVLYQVELLADEENPAFLRAYDGAPLAREDVRERWSFMTGAAGDPAFDFPTVEQEPTCDDILARLNASCGGGCCHGGESPAMGLRLTDLDALRATAIGKVARQTDLGDRIGVPLTDPARFGVGMPVIDPGNPHNSYLLYKLLLSPRNLEPCRSPDCEPFTALPGAERCRAPSEAERVLLAEWFVQGAPMPLDPAPGCAMSEPSAFDCATFQALARWIERGADCGN